MEKLKIICGILIVMSLMLVGCVSIKKEAKPTEEEKPLTFETYIKDNYDYCQIVFWNTFSFSKGQNIIEDMDLCAYLYEGCRTSAGCGLSDRQDKRYFIIGFRNNTHREYDLQERIRYLEKQKGIDVLQDLEKCKDKLENITLAIQQITEE